MITSKRAARVALGLLALVAAACTNSDDTEADGEDLSVADLKAYWADYRKLDVSDLTRAAVSFATPALNDKLAYGNVAANIDVPTVYAATSERNRLLPNGAQVHDLNAIVDGLATRFGEKELGTEVNRVRLDYLKSGENGYFVESGFHIKAGIDHSWSFDASGLLDGAGIRLGFDAGASLTTRVILATADANVSSYLKAPLQAAKDVRGFVLPESIANIRAMKPGEMFALRGTGRLGGNLGVGIPVLAAEPTGGMVYRIVVSGGVSAIIAGELDVQLVRLDGDQVIVDVGVENAKSVTVRAAVTDGWGIKAICDDGMACLRTIGLGPVKVDLQRLVEKSVEKQLNKHLSFKAEASATKASGRVGVSRMRFHLDRGNREEVERALSQALKLDTRLAFALYNRDLGQSEAAVNVEFDAVRSSTTSTTNFGFELMGMNLYQRAVVDKQGSFVVQTPDGARAILFDSLYKHTGLFQSEHGFTRTGVSAMTVSKEGITSEANLFVQTTVGDTHMDDDVLIDSADAVLAALAPKALDALDETGNEMERIVWDECFAPQGDGTTPEADCDLRLLDSSRLTGLKQRGLAMAEKAFGELPEDFRALAREAANTRLTLQSVHIGQALDGPKVSFALDYRLDDKALRALMSRSGDEYKEAVLNYLAAVRADRRAIGKDETRRGTRIATQNDFHGELDAMAKTFDERARTYRAILEAEKALPQALRGKNFVASPVGVRFWIEDDRASYESAAMQSLAHDRALVAQRLFDDLKSKGSKIRAPMYEENLAAYPLLALVPTRNLEIANDLQAILGDGAFQSPERFRKAGFKSVKVAAKGAEVSTISAGMFDLHAIIAGQ